MRQLLVVLVSLILTASSTLAQNNNTSDTTGPSKDWTFLIFLNGNNNLDSFGKMNIKQMEKVGSNKNVNIVVQWASLETGKTERLLIKKAAGSTVGSPIVQNLPKTDMGDWHSVVDFVKWGVQNYPAQHYFLDIWDHGSGWHAKNGTGLGNGIIQPMDISWDETTGHHITTEQLGLALTESAKIIGHKVDLYASDACLMAMVEVASEMSDSVSVYAGSEETEPGAGWPYDKFLARLSSLPQTPSAIDVAKILSEEYAKSYAGGGSGVTFSAFDMAALPAFNQAIRDFGKTLTGLTPAASKQVVTVINKSQSFTNSDYVDFVDFLNQLKASSISSMNGTLINSVMSATSKFIITSNNVGFPKAHGMSMWLPPTSGTLAKYADSYSRLKFDNETHWSTALKSILK